MSNHVQASDRSFSLYLSLKKLTQQFEELQELRARVRSLRQGWPPRDTSGSHEACATIELQLSVSQCHNNIAARRSPSYVPQEERPFPPRDAYKPYPGAKLGRILRSLQLILRSLHLILRSLQLLRVVFPDRPTGAVIRDPLDEGLPAFVRRAAKVRDLVSAICGGPWA